MATGDASAARGDGGSGARAQRQVQSTAPERITEDAQSGGAGIAVRWIFPDPTGPLLLLTDSAVVLGRDGDCDVVLGGSEVSRRHAEIRRDGPIFIVRDLGSTNGVFLNGRRISEAPLSLGDLVRLGDCIGLVVRGARAEDGGKCFGSPATGLLVGPVLGPLLEPVRRAAPSDLPIVLEGETGTGKELVARAIHEWSERPGPLVAVNCAALPESLAEAELFGYRKGAFTGADRPSEGYFRAAHRGTLLLDEVIDLPLSLQAKLLRALAQGEVAPLGEARAVRVDVRVVATSQEPIDRAVAAERFRADLYARLGGLTVRLPPVRERIVEVPYLLTRMLAERSGGRPPQVAARLVERLCLHDMPFNVRELDMLVRRLLVEHGHEAVLRYSHLPRRLREPARAPGGRDGSPLAPAAGRPAPPAGPRAAHEPEPVRAERDFTALVGALRVHRGVLARAAAAVGISRQRAYRLLKAHGGPALGTLREAGLAAADGGDGGEERQA
ncbi:MAG: sigma 54-interacting transcriptional regulator [Deltaproteobacteria bacterium]|nr:sigma 54-interacting transcriptional regulator [Deltaproteobacteria bacterium]